MKKLFLLPVVFLSLAFSSFSFTWNYSTPEEHGIDSKVIQKVYDGLKDKDVRSCIVIKDEKIISEYYKPGYSKNSIFSLQSVSKSITSALIGIAIDQGLIKSVDDPAYIYCPQLENAKNPVMKTITVKQLLNHTSGLLGTDSKIWNQWRNSSDWIEYILSRPMTATPGTFFEYSTGNTHLLAAILENVYKKSLLQIAEEQLFSKIGITSASCGTGPEGVCDGGNGFSMTAYDMARFGQLYCNMGKWEGKQIIPESWVKESTKVQARRPSTGSRYGYQWWIRNYGKNGYDGYCAQGFGGEFIFVVPKINLIVVFTSWHLGDTTFYYLDANAIADSFNPEQKR